jgi:hypothetical protein
LLEAGADPNARKVYMNNNEYGKVRSQGSFVTSGTRSGTWTYPLVLACCYASESTAIEMANLLILYGADINVIHRYLEEIRLRKSQRTPTLTY